MKTALRMHNHKDNTITAESCSMTMNHTSNQHARVCLQAPETAKNYTKKKINKMPIATSLHTATSYHSKIFFISTNNYFLLSIPLENHLCIETKTLA